MSKIYISIHSSDSNIGYLSATEIKLRDLNENLLPSTSETMPRSSSIVPHLSTSNTMISSEKDSCYYMAKADKNRRRNNKEWIEACKQGYNTGSFWNTYIMAVLVPARLCLSFGISYIIDSCFLSNMNGENFNLLLGTCVAINNHQNLFDPTCSKEYNNLILIDFICSGIAFISGTILVYLIFKKLHYQRDLLQVRTISEGGLTKSQYWWLVVMTLSLLVSASLRLKLKGSACEMELTDDITSLLFQIPGAKDFQPNLYNVNFSKLDLGFKLVIDLFMIFASTFGLAWSCSTDPLHMTSNASELLLSTHRSGITGASYTVTDFDKMYELYQTYKKEHPNSLELLILHAHVLEGLKKGYIHPHKAADNAAKKSEDYLRRERPQSRRKQLLKRKFKRIIERRRNQMRSVA